MSERKGEDHIKKRLKKKNLLLPVCLRSHLSLGFCGWWDVS